MKKRKVCIVILILAIIALLIGISYLVQGIYARGFGGVNYGSVIFPLLVGVIAVYFMKKTEAVISGFPQQVYNSSIPENSWA